MLTRCPDCGTNFRVSPAQIKARAGTVRCGRCNFVFNALDTLADDVAGVAVKPELVEAPVAPATAEPQAYDLPAVELGDTGSNANPIGEKTSPDSETAHLEAHADEGNPLLEDYLVEPTSPSHVMPTKRWPWILGSVVAAFGLLVQSAYYYRVELGVLRPDLRPLLQAACKPLRCEVPRPRRAETLSIDASDMHPDPQQPGHMTLSATLRSKAVYAQEWPLLELTLTDVADRKLAVKHFAVSDYLPKSKNIRDAIAAGFPANGEVAVNLALDVGDMPAAGYRLYVFYP